MSPRYDVAIVGLGPTGATLAAILGDHGLRVLVLDREPALYDLPRAVHFDDEVMRVFQSIGCADALAQKVIRNPGMRFVDGDGRVLVDWPRPQAITDLGWHASYRFHQPDLERVLRAALTRRRSVEICLGRQVTAIEEDATGATLHHQPRAGGPGSHDRARYVIGCDGARSIVAAHIDAGRDRAGFEQRWLVIDLCLRRPRPDLGDLTVQFCDPATPATYCRNPGNRRRWEFALSPGEDGIEMHQPAAVWRRLARWITPEDADLERAAVYTFKSENARCWATDRIAIAGDAAHLMPPFLGQGMCAGIRDAANLAWKLAALCRGRGDRTLLQSYQAERRSHVAAYIARAVEMGAVINRLQSAPAGPDPVAMKSLDIPLGDGGAPWRSAGPHTGKPARQIRLRNGVRIDDWAGHRPLAISRTPIAPLPGLACLDAATAPETAEYLDRYGADAVLIRPDRILHATEAGPDAGERLLARNAAFLGLFAGQSVS